MSKELVNQLNQLIADTTVFYQKLRHYHWNVKGPMFFQLHEKFEVIYDEVNLVIDEIAERIVGLNGVPVHTLDSMVKMSTLDEDPDLPSPEVMVTNLIKDIETINGKLQDTIETAEDVEDRTTANLLDEIKDGLEAHLWMLKAWETA